MLRLLTLPLLAISLMLSSGCSTKPVVMAQPVPPIPAEYKVLCPPLPPLTSRLPSAERSHHFLTALGYRDCAARMERLVGAVNARERSE